MNIKCVSKTSICKIIANLNKFYCRPWLVFLVSALKLAWWCRSKSLLHILRSETASHFDCTKRHKRQGRSELLERTCGALFWCVLFRRDLEYDSKHRNYSNHNLLYVVEFWGCQRRVQSVHLTASFQSTWRTFGQVAYKRKVAILGKS